MGLHSRFVVVLLLFGWVCNAWSPLKMSPEVTPYPVSAKSNVEAKTAMAAVSKAQTQLGQSVAAAISQVQAALGQVRPMAATTPLSKLSFGFVRPVAASVPLGQAQFGQIKPAAATGSQGQLQLGQVGPALATVPAALATLGLVGPAVAAVPAPLATLGPALATVPAPLATLGLVGPAVAAEPAPLATVGPAVAAVPAPLATVGPAVAAVPAPLATVGPAVAAVPAPLATVGPAVAAVPPAQISPSAIKVTCSESSVLVEMQRDQLGIGQLIQSADITLGGCAPVVQDASAQVLRFESELQDCGSKLMMTDNSLVYTFTLIYIPTGIGGTPIVRTNGAVLSIECHYLRKQNVSSDSLVPTWVPFSTTKVAEDILVFSLKLMTDDWQLDRTSNDFSLGDLLNIEASVTVANHHPLRVFVDSCVATSTPDVTSVPRYDLVVNHGCLNDSKLPASNSRFLPQKQDDKLQMQLDAFRFLQATSNLIYITCLLKATVAPGPTDETHKACSFSATRWTAADGNDQVCGCCDTDCIPRIARDLMTLWWESTAIVGPLSVAEKPLLHGGHHPPGAEVSKAEDRTAHSGVSLEVMALAGVLAAVALVVIGVLGIVLRWKRLSNCSQE
nr:zona pellucida sperm-binding protein 3-like isoform X3 [Paramormyrops kingsleyae]